MRMNHESNLKKQSESNNIEKEIKKRKREDKSGSVNTLQGLKATEKVKALSIKTNNTIACKMKQVVEKLIQRHKKNECWNNITIFIYKSQQSEIITSFLQEIKQENKLLFENKQHLLKAIDQKYEELIM
jgi:ribosomal protein L17